MPTFVYFIFIRVENKKKNVCSLILILNCFKAIFSQIDMLNPQKYYSLKTK